MTQHELSARAYSWAAATLCGIALLVIIAHAQAQDDADERDLRAHVERVRVAK